ncbi:GGDEF domain-containing protein [Lachnospiraceae bacterium ZAX-1]
MWNRLLELFILNIDIDTMFSALIYCNLATFILDISFRYFKNTANIDPPIQKIPFVRVGCILAYIFLFLRGTIPDFISVNIGNSLLLYYFFVDAMQLLMSINKWQYKVKNIEITLSVVIILLFNVVVMFTERYQVAVVSVTIFAIMCFPTTLYIFARDIEKTKRGIGVFYLLLILPLLPRAYNNIKNPSSNIFTRSIPQTLFFISLLMMTVASEIVHLFFLNEESDRIIEGYANNDNLTGLPNRRFFMENLERTFMRCQKNVQPIAMLFIDIDYFKNVNDNFGHQFGDTVLIKFAEVLQSSIRSDDLIGRYGGEEFIIVFKNSDKDFSTQAAERIRENIKNITFLDHPDFQFTISIGIAYGMPKEGSLIESLILASDEQMYKAKKDGRDRVAIANVALWETG